MLMLKIKVLFIMWAVYLKLWISTVENLKIDSTSINEILHDFKGKKDKICIFKGASNFAYKSIQDLRIKRSS